MALSMTAKIAIAAAAGLALVGLAGAGQSGGGAQRTPTPPPPPPKVPPPPPPTPQGTQNLGPETGRAWATFGVDQDAVVQGELVVFDIADNATGRAVVDVYETIEEPANADWSNYGSNVACAARRWMLTFENGIMVSAVDTSIVAGTEQPKCLAGSRPMFKQYEQVYLRMLEWRQRAELVVLVYESASGIDNGYTKPFAQPPSSNWKWDDDFVDSGSVLVDAKWKWLG